MGIPKDQLCDDLRRQFIATLRDAPISWWGVWTLLVQHECYQALLDQYARWLIYQHNTPREWLDDVKQDAILILASKLRRTPNLHYNSDRPASSFTPWLRAVVRSHCQDAIRGLRSYSARQLPLLSDPPEKLSAVDQRIDLHSAMLLASARERAALSLFAQGYTDSEIAQLLNLTIGQARALRLRGLRFLALLLSPGSSSAP
jgi:RNA polymerase sigma factor (sigma-70 family)